MSEVRLNLDSVDTAKSIFKLWMDIPCAHKMWPPETYNAAHILAGRSHISDCGMLYSHSSASATRTPNVHREKKLYCFG